MCKFPVFKKKLALKFFYDLYKIPKTSNPNAFQCLYCAYSDEKFNNLISHLIEFHPDFPLMYYDQSPTIKSSIIDETLPLMTDDESESGLLTEDLLTDDESDEDIRKYVCFFCDQHFRSLNSAKFHMLHHLYSPNLVDESEKILSHFFESWISKFLSLQHNFESPSETYPNCPICKKLGNNLTYNYDVSLIDTEAHYLKHSAIQQIKCLACRDFLKIDFFLTNIDEEIINHWQHHHSDLIRARPLNRFDFKQVIQWKQIIKNLFETNLLSMYSSKNEKLFKNLNESNQKALIRLDSIHQMHLSSLMTE